MARSCVGIVIPNWNGTQDTLECLESLKGLVYANHRVYVVDNGSATPCADSIRASFPSVEVIRLDRNLGFAGACNVGIRQALADGAQYVWLLNNDTAVDANALTAMVEAAEDDPYCGIVGSKILYYDNPNIINHAGGRIRPWIGRCEHIGCGTLDGGQFDNIAEVDYVTGCSLLAKKAMIEEVGLMDEDYFLYWEETDWCLRARRKGWRVKYAPHSRVYHKVSRGLGRASLVTTYYWARNSLLFFHRHYPWLQALSLLWWPRWFVVNNLLKGRWPQLRMALAALRDYSIHRWGSTQ